MTRSEHVKWCKERALAYLDRGELADAVTSMASDMEKHDETRGVCSPHLTMLAMMDIASGNTEGVRRWITGFAE